MSAMCLRKIGVRSCNHPSVYFKVAEQDLTLLFRYGFPVELPRVVSKLGKP